MAFTTSSFVEDLRLAALALADFGNHLVSPTLRLGVTGLSRSGKTVFITALIHGLLHGSRFPVFEALANGRIARVRLAPQPDQGVPRFDYEAHVRALVDDRRWPESTHRVSELRLVIEYQSQNAAMRTLTLDIVDYPGEWLLDLPLLNKSYETWASESLAASRRAPRAQLASEWHAHLATLRPEDAADEQASLIAARLFTEYLQACRNERFSMSLLPPGRFLMPGDLAGSPALTFAPIILPHDRPAPEGSLWSMMQQRFEAYKSIVVRPFFRDYFARLDRQIVLVDLLAAINAGPDSVLDLQNTLATVMDCFNIGRKTMFSAIFRPRIERILFAATKADHLHQSNHDRLEALLKRMVERAITHAEFSGSRVDAIALAAIRVTREAMVKRGRDELPAIVGAPLAGESAEGQPFDGTVEAAMFSGDLPYDPAVLFRSDKPVFRGLSTSQPGDTDFRFLRFRPPVLDAADGVTPALPHIRLDRALQFLIGDQLT